MKYFLLYLFLQIVLLLTLESEFKINLCKDYKEFLINLFFI